MGSAFDITRFPVHLGLGARVVPLPEFDGQMSWYQHYGEAHADDGAEGRLVSLHAFSAPWDSWEVHPNGGELVLCLSGEITLVQEIDGEERRTTLSANQAVINPPGVWHTADVADHATALFITAGMGTEVRPR
jgi:mannose-6-phosphate isomerase-like protein (cupin superfamily)